jgi:hypothetical protein
MRSAWSSRHSAVIAAAFIQIAASAPHWQGLPGRLSFHSPVGVLPEFTINLFTSSPDPIFIRSER